MQLHFKAREDAQDVQEVVSFVIANIKKMSSRCGGGSGDSRTGWLKLNKSDALLLMDFGQSSVAAHHKPLTLIGH